MLDWGVMPCLVSCCCGFFLWPLAGKGGKNTLWCVLRAFRPSCSVAALSQLYSSAISALSQLQLSFIAALSQLYRCFIAALSQLYRSFFIAASFHRLFLERHPPLHCNVVWDCPSLLLSQAGLADDLVQVVFCFFSWVGFLWFFFVFFLVAFLAFLCVCGFLALWHLALPPPRSGNGLKPLGGSKVIW